MSTQQKYLIYLAVVVCFLFPLGLQGQGVWKYQRKPLFSYPNNFNDIFSFKDTSIAWAVGERIIAKTTDRGETWIKQYSGYGSGILLSVWFNTLNTGWVCGYSGKMLRTTDGGDTWTQCNSGTTTNLWGISFWDDSTGIAVGYSHGLTQNGTIIRTTDGGANWETVLTASDYGLTGVKCIGNDTAWVSAWHPFTPGPTVAYRTVDKGITWEPITVVNYNTLAYAIEVLNGGLTVWILAQQPGHQVMVYKTTDGGLSWDSYGTGIGSPPSKIRFRDDKTGWICGGSGEAMMSYIAKTTNGGISWNICQQPAHETISNVCCFDSPYLCAVGGMEGGTILLSNDGGDSWYYLTNGEDFLALAAPDTSNIWACGNYGIMLHSSDGGNTWVYQQPFSYAEPALPIYAASFPTVTTGYIGGYEGLIRKTTDGGQTWFPVQPIGGRVNDIKFVNPLIGWAITSSAIYKTTDGGYSWTPQKHCKYSFELNRIDMVDSLYGWVVCKDWWGSAPTILHTTDGGTNWIPIEPPIPNSDWQDVDFIDRKNGYIVGHDQWVIKTTDGGLSWTTIDLSSFQCSELYGVAFGDVDHGWVFTHHCILHTEDGGLTWHRDSIETSNEILERPLLACWPVAADPTHAWWSDFYSFPTACVLGYYSPTGVEEPSVNEGKGLTDYGINVYTNPFRSSTTIQYQIQQPVQVKLCIYDVIGRLVKKLIDKEQVSGSYKVKWDAENEGGKKLSAGVYFCELQAGNLSFTKPIILIQ